MFIKDIFTLHVDFRIFRPRYQGQAEKNLSSPGMQCRLYLSIFAEFAFEPRKHSTQLLDQVGMGDNGEVSCPLVCDFFAG